MSLIGIHIGNINSIIDPINKRYNFFQLFVSSLTDYEDTKYSHVFEYIKKNNISLVVHGSYSINLARRWNNYDWWIQQFIREIYKSNDIGAFGIVVHTGKQLKLSNAEAINNMYSSLLYIHNNTLDCKNVKIFIETPSGQGTETLIKIEDLCRFMNKFYQHTDPAIKNRFGICIDTCHLYAAGYDLSIESEMDKYFSRLNKEIGLDKIKLCHVNDSKGNLGAKLDRHSNIGNGYIGKKGILRIVKFMKRLEIPMILETPSAGIGKDYDIISS